MSIYGLFGSSILPSTLDINGKQVPLGDVVRFAFEESNLSPKDWNVMDEEQREAKLERALRTMRAA